MRKWTALGVAFLIAVAAGMASYAPPPPGPIGWETRITPGFDPPIEYVLVYEMWGPSPGAALGETIAKWGPQAAPALIGLYQTPDWEDRRSQILTLLSHFEGDEVTAFLCEEAVRQVETPVDEKRRNYLLSQLLGSLGKRDPSAADAIVTDILGKPDSPHLDTAIGYLLSQAAQPGGEAYRDKLERIADTTEVERISGWIRTALEQNAAQTRANEPMRTVLEQEGQGQ
jgi:hypothetical protein